MDLGQFSVSLAVKDIATSRAFYEKLGFTALTKEGEEGPWESYEKDWVILTNDDVVIGLFQGMFEANILTFNPTDVRAVQAELKEAGMTFTMEADEATRGPASAMLADPDGNTILLDQHNE